MEPEQEYAEIRALLRAMSERQNETEIWFKERTKESERRMEQSERRMGRLEERAEESERRMDRFDRQMAAAEKRAKAADARMDKFEKQLQRTRALVEAGMKIVVDLAKSQRELAKSQKAFMDSLRKGNGNGRH
jgi:chromosome segregation ATPase